MRVITTSSDQDLHSLVHEIYAVPTRNSERLAREAERALVEANPHLGRRTRVAAGTPLVIPEHPDLPFKPTEPITRGTLQDLHGQVQDALGFARAVYESSAKDAAEEARDSLAILRSPEFKAAGAEVNVDTLTAQLNNRAKNAETQAKADLDAIDELSRGLEEFSKLIAF